jgi:chromosome condensin MukBEF ATPase and DNA-binding subunit MukB
MENESMIERRENCEMHSGTQALLAEHSKAIVDLYDKHDNVMALLNEIKLCTATMAMKLDNGFEQANKNISHLSDKIEKFQIEREKTLSYYDAIVDDIQKQLAELNEFKWFRTRLNKWKDNLPSFIFGLIMMLLGLLAVLNWPEIGNILKGKIK